MRIRLTNVKLAASSFVFLAVTSLSPALGAVAAISKTVQVTSAEVAVATGSGHQEDPHISGSLIAYADLGGAHPASVRYYDMLTGTTTTVPQGASEFDSVPDVDRGRITFTKINAAGSSIHLFDPATTALHEIGPGSAPRDSSAIGGNTIAFVQSVSDTEHAIAVHDLTSSTTTLLPHGGRSDRSPAVSPNGNAIVWSSCDNDGQNCDIRQALRDATGWVITTLTDATGSENGSDTDGAIVVYDSLRAGERDLYWQSLGGGAETQLSLPGNAQSPSVSDGLLVLEGDANGNYEIYAYDTVTSTFYQVTSSPFPELLADVDVVGDVATIVYTKNNGVDNDIFARSFNLNRQLSAEQQLTSLRALIAASNNHLTKALDAKLRATGNALATGDTAAACTALQDFINHVNAQRAKKIAVFDADAWIAAAEQIRLGLGCA